jgi:integrase
VTTFFVKKTQKKPSAKTKKPVEIVEHKNQKIPIYFTPETKRGKVYKSWTYSYTEAGRRVRRRAASLEDAQKGAKNAAEQLAEGMGRLRTLTPGEFTDFIAAEKILRSHPTMSLAAVVSEWEQAVTRLDGKGRLIDAVKVYLESLAAKEIPECSVRDMVTKFMEAKRREGLSDFYLTDIERRLERFAESFKVDIATIQPEEIKLWLASTTGSGRNANNYRSSVATLFSFARECGFLPRHTKHAAELVSKAKEKPSAIGIFTPAELGKILAATPQKFLPSVAIAAFAGLRSAEIFRLDWSEVHLDRGHIVVAAEKAKTASRRIVPIVPALGAWLATCKNRKGRVSPDYARLNNLTRGIDEICVGAGVKPKHNAFRHSFASYRLAEVKSADQVALEMGNSPRKLFSNYREIVSTEEAAAWFALTPDAIPGADIVAFAA